MELRKLDERCSVSPQLHLEDVATLAARGFRTLVSNRPDGEEPEQVSADRFAIAAAAHGMTFVHIPVVPGAISDDDVSAFSRMLADSPGRVFAFCRTGTRAASLWALNQPVQRSADDVLAVTRNAGYDLHALRERLDAARQSIAH